MERRNERGLANHSLIDFIVLATNVPLHWRLRGNRHGSGHDARCLSSNTVISLTTGPIGQ